ncbi:putative Aldo/keto reductase [Candidatus Sulfopaludibacter sp. SbA6]|nr:putative Aldo/keto reductase [Candidatus Sulfopaludibacter sp. SbA6]
MKRRVFVGSAFAGLGLTGAYAQPPKLKAGDVPMKLYGRTGAKVTIIAQGGARMDLHPNVAEAAAHVRRVYEMGVNYFDCARSYWNGKSEEAYGIGLEGVRKDVFLTSKTTKRTRLETEQELALSLKSLKTDYLDIWQMHDVRTKEEIDRILGPGGAMEAFEAAKKAGKCRFIGFTGHFDPQTHAAMLKAYDHWDSVLMPVHAADHAYLSFEKTALPVAVEKGVGIQAIKVFCKAFLLRALSPCECLTYTLSMGVHVAICGAGTEGQMEDNIRTAQSFKPLAPADLADLRRKAVVGQGVYTGPTMEYWKKA